MKKTNRFLIFAIIFLLLITLTGGALIAYKHFFAKDKSYLGSWEREVSLRSYVIDDMNEWFNDPSTASFVSFSDKEVNVKLVLEFTDDGRFSEEIDKDSYDAARKAAYELAVSGLISFLEKRLENSGTNLEDVGKTVDELIEEALGMSAGDYLAQSGPSLLPPLSALEEIYNTSGSYETSGGVMKRNVSGSEISEAFFTKDDYIVFTGEKSFEASDGFASPLYENVSGVHFLYDYPVVYTKR